MNSVDWSTGDRLFVFGSLMDTDVLSLVAGTPIENLQLCTAIADGYRQCEVQEESYPVLTPCEESRTTGVLIAGLDSLAIERIRFFEGEEYRLQRITIFTGSGVQIGAYYFCDTGAYTFRPCSWDFDQWVANHKDSFIEASRQYMALFGTMTAAEADAYWGRLTGNDADAIDRVNSVAG